MDKPEKIDKKVTLDVIANEAGVSLATVSYVLSGKKKVSREVTEKIKRIAEAYNYTPLSAGRNKRSSQSNLIGFLVLPNAVDPRDDLFAFTVQQGIYSKGAAEQYFLVYNKIDDINSGNADISGFIEAVSGVIILNPREDNGYKSLLTALDESDKPYVLIGTPDSEDTFYVDMDIEGAAYQGANLLFELGCRDIIYVDSPLGMKQSVQIKSGYRLAGKDWDVTWQENNLIYAKEVSVPEGMRLTGDIIDGGTHFDAVITPNEILAKGVLTALDQYSVKVPERCKVLSLGGGINNLDPFSPKLTTIDYQPYTLGEEAMKMLVEIIQKKRIRPSHIILPAKLNRKQTA
jgi:LacI family transcriptional regulator